MLHFWTPKNVKKTFFDVEKDKKIYLFWCPNVHHFGAQKRSILSTKMVQFWHHFGALFKVKSEWSGICEWHYFVIHVDVAWNRGLIIFSLEKQFTKKRTVCGRQNGIILVVTMGLFWWPKCIILTTKRVFKMVPFWAVQKWYFLTSIWWSKRFILVAFSIWKNN